MKKILVIENDLAILDILDFFLDDLGFEVLKAPKRIPIEEIITDNPDLVLLDYFLDEGSGKDICLEIKSNPATRHIPVLIMSVSNDIGTLALESCADAFISKPFDISNLENMVKQMA